MTFTSRSRSMFVVRSVVLLIAVITLPGCVVGPDFSGMQMPIPKTWHQRLKPGDFEAVYTSPEDLRNWWTLLNDPCLNELIDCADDGNLDLYAAFNRIKQANAQVCIVDSQRRLQMNRSNGYRRLQQSTNAFGVGGFAIALGAFDLWDSGLAASWELDIFGHIERQVESACALEAASVEDYRDILVILYGEIASTYVRIRTTQAQIKFAEQNVDLQERALDLATKRVEGGVSPILDQYQAESNLAGTKSAIPPLVAALHTDLNRLAVLLGYYPGAVHECLAQPAPIPSPGSRLPVIVPCDLTRQRPDIRQAERLVAARTAEIGVAQAELFPRLAIAGNYGVQSQKVSNLFDKNSVTYSFGPNFSWPILAGGRIMCNMDRAEAAAEEAIANYEQTVLLAVEEVENAIVLFQKEQERRDALAETVKASELALESVLKTYRAGRTDFNNVLNGLRTLFVSQNELAVSEGQVVQFLIGFYRALGGGWTPRHHCPDRIVRVTCPQRGDAEVVENIPAEDPSERYFDVPETQRDPSTAPNLLHPNGELPTPPMPPQMDDVLPRPAENARRLSRDPSPIRSPRFMTKKHRMDESLKSVRDDRADMPATRLTQPPTHRQPPGSEEALPRTANQSPSRRFSILKKLW